MKSGTRRRERTNRAAALLLAGFCAAASCIAAPAHADYQRLVAEEPHMGTLVRITAYVPDGTDGVHALRAAFDRVRGIDARFSDYREDSEINRISREACEAPVQVSDDLFALLEKATDISKRTGGAFDVTIGALTRLWRRSYQEKRPPTPAAIAHARRRTGWANMIFDTKNRSLYLLRAGIRFDFGGIAKGYAADQALAELRRFGIDRALVAVAGDIAAGDPPPGESAWIVGIDAIGGSDGIERKINLANEAVSTSGGRERSFTLGGRVYSHIINPSAEWGAAASQAVTVVASSGIEADGWATALHIVGKPDSEPLLRSVRNLRAYWSTASQEIEAPLPAKRP